MVVEMGLGEERRRRLDEVACRQFKDIHVELGVACLILGLIQRQFG